MNRKKHPGSGPTPGVLVPTPGVRGGIVDISDIGLVENILGEAAAEGDAKPRADIDYAEAPKGTAVEPEKEPFEAMAEAVVGSLVDVKKDALKDLKVVVDAPTTLYD